MHNGESSHLSRPEYAEDGDQPLLSICVPTYNRSESLSRLLTTLLSKEGAFEVCVHVDGSTDGTLQALQTMENRRLRLSTAPNQGRAGALLAACRLARGRFVMIFDDDDELYLAGLQAVLEDCALKLPDDTVGYAYHLHDEQGLQIGADFPVGQSNFLAIRADHGVKGDKKEVVLREAMLSASYDSGGRSRRVPTSLLWTRLALRSDVVCRNRVIGRKSYLRDGMTANISNLKSVNALPMTLLYYTHVLGFVRARYRSLRFLGKALIGIAGYGTLAAFNAIFPLR